MVRVRSVNAVAKYELSVTLPLVRGIGKMTHSFFCSIRNDNNQIMEWFSPLLAQRRIF